MQIPLIFKFRNIKNTRSQKYAEIHFSHQIQIYKTTGTYEIKKTKDT